VAVAAQALPLCFRPSVRKERGIDKIVVKHGVGESKALGSPKCQ
jgi:hypothetical protein